MQSKELSQKVPMLEKIGYSMGDGAANLAFQMMMMFQMFFYTDVFGIKATAAGTILLVARLVDAFVDPMVGILADRTSTRWGKYRPWVLWTAIPFAVFFVLAFTTPDAGEQMKIIYAGVTYTLLMAVYSFNNTPYASLGGVMSSDIRERTNISSVRFVTATVATFVVQGLTLPMVSKLGNGQSNDPKGWFWTILVFALVGVVLMVITFFSSKERIEPPKDQQNNFRQDFKDLIHCTPWKAMFALTLFLFITLALFGSAMSYYFNYFVDKTALQQFLVGFGLVSNGEPSTWHSFLNLFGLISKPDLSNVFSVGFSFFNIAGQIVTLFGVLLLSQPLSERFGKKSVFIVCMTLTAIFTGLFFVVRPEQIGWIFIINLLKNAAYAPTIPLLWAMMGDVADFSEWKNYRRATGFCFAGIVFALKAGLGVGGAICGILVAAFGFEANTVQSAHSLLGIRLTASIVPAITFFIATAALFFYPITKKLNITMQGELTDRRRGQ
jgi:Na+/melibiose symporter-like transporter